MGTKSRETIYGASIRASAERAREVRREADRLACVAWNQRMLRYKGPAQPSPALGDALNAGYRYNLASYMDEVCDAGAPILLIRRNARNVVLMSADDYDGLMETVHLLKSPANAARLLRSINDAGPGQGKIVKRLARWRRLRRTVGRFHSDRR
jgi:prevent-host-death family protein